MQYGVFNGTMLLTLATNEGDVAAESNNHQPGNLTLAHAQIYTHSVSN